MSESFFESLGIPNPDINLEIGSGTHAGQVDLSAEKAGNIMMTFEKAAIQGEFFKITKSPVN